MHSLTFGKDLHNSKLFFSSKELGKILSCYYLGVSRGSWKDYAINFKNNEANFFMFKHSLASPDCVLTKSKKFKRNEIIFKLKLKNEKRNNSKQIDDLLIILKRNHFKII